MRRPVKHLKQAAEPLGKTANSSANAFTDINRLFNAWAYNPPGGEEGYLFWTAWLNHNANTTALLQDANGPLPRGVVLQSCRTARLAESLAVARPFIKTLQQYTNAPQSTVICPLDPSDVGGGITFRPSGARWRLGLRRSPGSWSRSASCSPASGSPSSSGSRSAARSR